MAVFGTNVKSVDDEVLALCTRAGERWDSVAEAWQHTALLAPLVFQVLTRSHRDTAALGTLLRWCDQAASELGVALAAERRFAEAISRNRLANQLHTLRNTWVLEQQPVAAALADSLVHIAEAIADPELNEIRARTQAIVAALVAAMLQGNDPASVSVAERRAARSRLLGWLRQVSPTLP